MTESAIPDTLHASLKSSATQSPEQVALVCEGSSITFGELLERSCSVAGGLAELGVGRGDRVAFLGRDSFSLYEILYGCAHLGAVLVPVNWRLSALETAFVLGDSQARVLFTDREQNAESAAEHVLSLSERQFDQWREGRTPHRVTASPHGRDDAIVQMYTSGTTGTPKGVVLAHRTFFAIRELLDNAGLDWIDWKPSDVNLVALPSFHIGGLWWGMQGMNAGVRNVILPAFSAVSALEAIRTQRVTSTCLVPAMMLIILSDSSCTAGDFKSVRKVVYGGSPIGRSLLTRAQTLFDCELAQIYGLTETGNTALCLPPAEHGTKMSRIEAAGRPYPGVEIEVVDSDGTQVPAGDVGEILIKSPARMLEYFHRPEATAETLVDGWIRTGDAGYVDSEGFLFIRDRVKDMIIVGGEKVFPAEIEQALTDYLGVHDAAVVGIPDDRWGESVLAFIERSPGATVSTRDVVKHLNGRIAAFKMPSKYEFVTSIPRNPSGKILRRSLREKYWADRERQVN